MNTTNEILFLRTLVYYGLLIAILTVVSFQFGKEYTTFSLGLIIGWLFGSVWKYIKKVKP